MSKPKVFEKPVGVKDYLPGAVKKLKNIEQKVLQCMEGWGYQQIITPTIEFYDTVGAASSISDSKLFKLLNNKGTPLVLRSDMTAPIARVVSSLLKTEELPLRLSYHANVFRTIEEEAGRDAEFFQTGLELVGDDSAEADAEVIALSIASLKAAGVNRFKLAMGHVSFLNGLLEEKLAGRELEKQSLRNSLLKRDYVGYREYLDKLDLAEEDKRALAELLRLRGGEDTLQRALQVTQHELAKQAISHLQAIWTLLKAYDVSDCVVLDLSMVGDFEYYTGMTFEGYASDLGFPIVSGGRYDKLLAQFGRPAPATGFALKTTRILELLGLDVTLPTNQTLVIYNAYRSTDAIKSAAKYRENGHTVIMAMKQKEEHIEQLVVRTDEGLFKYKGKLYNQVEVLE